MNGMARYKLRLLGAFQLTAPNGQRIVITSKKAIALLALLASADSGERWRAWIQDKLWGSRELRQAQASLRRELHGLRKLTANTNFPLVETTSRAVRLNLQAVDVDIRNAEIISPTSGEFLEGIDIAGEESFEEWLREMRSGFAEASGTLQFSQNPHELVLRDISQGDAR